jgi:hypothetical protein
MFKKSFRRYEYTVIISPTRLWTVGLVGSVLVGARNSSQIVLMRKEKKSLIIVDLAKF